MKLILIMILSIFFLASCAHHHKDVEHHHHKSCDKNCKISHGRGEMFDKYCAQSISEGDLHIKGSEDFNLSHGGKVYYFSTKKKLEKFKVHIEKNTKMARKNWSLGLSRQ